MPETKPLRGKTLFLRSKAEEDLRKRAQRPRVYHPGTRQQVLLALLPDNSCSLSKLRLNEKLFAHQVRAQACVRVLKGDQTRGQTCACVYMHVCVCS